MIRTLIVILACTLLAVTPCRAGASPACPPCLAFDRLDKEIRDGRLPRAEAEQQFAARIADIEADLARDDTSAYGREQWVFPLPGHTLAKTGAEAAKGYIAVGYDYFDGNRHGGHPSYDLFITDRNRDSRDDASGQPVTVVSMTGGIVIAAEEEWTPGSPLRGGRYLWIYEPTERLLLYYAHNETLLARVGERVAPGTPIATVGRSGLNAWKDRSPTHLHLTVLKIRSGRPLPDNEAGTLSRLRTLP